MPQDQIFELRIASSADERRAAQRLRYEVFVAELGGDGPMVDHSMRLEIDRYDPYFDHLLLLDRRRGGSFADQVIGAYRVMRETGAEAAGQFYSADEFDLAPLLSSGLKLLELGRSCVHPDYRGGAAMFHLWQGLADYVLEHEIELMFGAASFHGTDLSKFAQPLSYLYHHHLAPESLRVRARPEHYQTMELVPRQVLDRKAALVATPALIKGYLRLGGTVADGAYIDHAFKTTDVCLILDTGRMNESQRRLYGQKPWVG
ncbi:MAG: GNAT family N-acyltransferase [Pseudomonadota bacterium]